MRFLGPQMRILGFQMRILGSLMRILVSLSKILGSPIRILGYLNVEFSDENMWGSDKKIVVANENIGVSDITALQVGSWLGSDDDIFFQDSGFFRSLTRIFEQSYLIGILSDLFLNCISWISIIFTPMWCGFQCFLYYIRKPYITSIWFLLIL